MVLAVLALDNIKLWLIVLITTVQCLNKFCIELKYITSVAYSSQGTIPVNFDFL